MRKIIFDLDGTLYTSKELWNNREKDILNLVGDKVDSYRGLRKTNTTTQSLLRLGIKREEFFNTLAGVDIPLKKDEKLRNLLLKIKETYKIIVLSNVPSVAVKKTLEKLGVLDLIDLFYGAENFKNSKPAEECFFMVDKGDICVGNNFKKDLLVPKNKGAVTIYVGSNPNYQSHFNIRTIYELEEVLKNI